MIEQYEKELKNLKKTMIKAEQFAERVPLFYDKIIKNKWTGEEPWLQFGYSYKKIPLSWGINRGYYESSSPRNITNLNDQHNGFFFHVYINPLSLYEEHNLFDLHESFSGVDIFFVDYLNTGFYVTDENIEDFLEALNSWYEKVFDKVNKYRLEKNITKLEKELEDKRSILLSKESLSV